MESTGDANDHALAAVALIEAYIRRDKEGVDAVLSERADHTAILSALLMLMEHALTLGSGGRSQVVLDAWRSKLLERMTDGEGEL